jgi:5-methylcytosine-specific restriction enzyme subunit McrC
MSTLYEFGELDRTGVVLSPTRAERLALSRLEGRLGVEWRPDGSARVYPRGYVGSVALSPDTTVRVTTKVPVANILALASLAYHTVQIPRPHGDALLEPVSDAIDWLALLLVAEIEALLAHGLRQDYVVVQDDLPYVRGRLCFEATAIWANRARVTCEFADFLPDIPENRILRAGLELLATQRLLPGLHVRVEQLLAGFQRVAFIRPFAEQLPSWHITRLNRHYEPALELCRLLFDQADASLEVGSLAAPAYFFPMETVFQEAVTTLLRNRLPSVARQREGSHQPVSGSPARPLTFAPDIVIGSPPSLVLDAKYAAPEVRNQYGGWSFHNAHVYQVAFYGLSLGCPAVLVYPRTEGHVDVAFEIDGVAVRLMTVDLNQPGLAGLDAFAATVEDLVSEAVTV